MSYYLSLLRNSLKGAFGPFLEAFLQNHGCPWTFKNELDPLDNHMTDYGLKTPEFQDSIRRYQETLQRQVDFLRQKYREVLSNPHGRLTRFPTTNIGLPFLQAFHLDYLIEKQVSRFAAMAAMFFLIANLTLENYHHSNSIHFIDSVVDGFADYVTPLKFDVTSKFGGWKHFFGTLVNETISTRMTEEAFGQYVETCVTHIFTGKYESEEDFPRD